MKGYEFVARALAANGVTTVFGVMGDGNMLWVSSYADLPGMTWAPAWHEAGAIWMADGYSVATGRAGIATVTMGPGLAQSIAALVTVARSHRGVVLITSEVDDTVPPHAQAAPQRTWVESAGGRYVRVDRAEQFGRVLVDALEFGATGVPTVVAVHPAAYTAEVENDPALAPLGRDGANRASRKPTGDIEYAAALLATATAPLVVIGHGVIAAGCLPAALGFGRRLGAAFVTTVFAKRALPDEPFALGLTGMMANPLAREVTSNADLVVVLGASLDNYNTDGATLAAHARLIRVDRRDASELWNPDAREVVSISGELPSVIDELTRSLPETPRQGLRTDALRDAIGAEKRRAGDLIKLSFDDGPNPWAVVGALDLAIPSDAHVVVGIGHFWYFVAPYLGAVGKRTFHFGSGFALIGQALPAAVGAAFALTGQDARPVVAIEGDGAMMMNLQELHSAVRLGVDLLLVVLNNRSYGSEYHKLRVEGLDSRTANLDESVDFVAFAQAAGAEGRRAENLDQLNVALDDLVHQRGVRLIDAAIARSPMSEVYVRQHTER